VTPLEPRTPHQPEKLKKLSKNDYLFTPSIACVNEKLQAVTTRIFNRVHAIHRPMTGFGAGSSRTFPSPPRRMPLFDRCIDGNQCEWRLNDSLPACENL
jgi:hypothetical protein